MRLCRTRIVLSLLFVGLLLGCGTATTPVEDPGEVCEVDIDCNEGASCQTGVCDLDKGECAYTINDNACLADGNCHLGGSTPEDDLCKVCDPTVDNTTLQAVICAEGEVCDSEQGCVAAADTCGGDDANCVNENPCMVGTCGDDGLCTFAGDEGASCDDADECTTGDACAADGACAGTYDNEVCSCDADHPCPEENCQTVTCEEAACVYVNVENDSECDDSNVCTQEDSCLDGACGGTPVVIDDCGDQCNEGACIADCDADGVCEAKCDSQSVADGKPCDDASKCTTGDYCEAGACTSKWDYKICQCQDAGECDEKMGQSAPQCQQWACDGDPAESTKCVPEPGADSDVCDDGDACTENDACQAGKCTSGNTLQCEDTANPCTDLKCNPAKGCQEINLDASTPCSDGQYCTDGDHCDGKGACVGGGPTLCNDPDKNPCNVPVCDEDTDSCPTKDAADGTTCETGDVCVTEATCKSGDCTADAFKECTTDNPCMTIACDSDQSKGCVETPVAKGTLCGDEQVCPEGNKITYADKCDTKGNCKIGATLSCPGGNLCASNDKCKDSCSTIPFKGASNQCAQPYYCSPTSVLSGTCKCENKTWTTGTISQNEQDVGGTSFSHCSTSKHGQTFTPSYDSKLKSVKVKLIRGNCTCKNSFGIPDCGSKFGDVTMEIFKTSKGSSGGIGPIIGGSAPGLPTGSAIGSATVDVGNLTSGGKNHTFQFKSQNIELEGETMYAMVLTTDSTKFYVNWRSSVVLGSDTGTYSNGTAVTYTKGSSGIFPPTLGSWKKSSAVDNLFDVNYDVTCPLIIIIPDLPIPPG